MTLVHKKWLVVPLLALILSSCSGESGGGAASEGGNSATADTEATSDSSYVDITDQQGSAPDFEGAIGDASVERCEAEDNGWVSAGTVVNSTESAQNYRVYVAFNRNNDTRGLVQVDIDDLAPGAEDNWEVQAPISGDDFDCILRVERFPNE